MRLFPRLKKFRLPHADELALRVVAVTMTIWLILLHARQRKQAMKSLQQTRSTAGDRLPLAEQIP
jgi:hypothetical protein